jgi:hypothetical protein
MARTEENGGTLSRTHLARSRKEPFPNRVSVAGRARTQNVVAAASHRPIGRRALDCAQPEQNVNDK